MFPCNVLDVMVVCWAAQPVDRPSASQIVSMTTAPEFTHLLDVISLNDSDSAVHSTLSFPSIYFYFFLYFGILIIFASWLVKLQV